MTLKKVAVAALAGIAPVLGDPRAHNIAELLNEDSVVHISHDTLKENSHISHLLSDQFGSGQNGLHFRLSKDALRVLHENDVDFEDHTESWIAHFEKNQRDPKYVCQDGPAACAARSAQDFYASYQERDALIERVTNIAADVDFAEIGSIGTSYEGNDLTVVHIGDQTKPLVFYFCNIHAREWLTPMYCTYMAEELMQGHPLLDSFSFTILISANPDGYLYTWSNDRFWRKTRKPNPGSSCTGTDPNRNYDVNHCGAGSATDPCSETYCGVSPFDNLETAAIRDFGLQNEERLIKFNDVHSYSSMWMYPYGSYTSLPPQSDLTLMDNCAQAGVDAIQDVSGATWAMGPIEDTIYQASGNSVDYFYDELGVVYSYTLELRGTSFDPPASNILPSNIEVFAGMVASLECIAEQESIPTPPPVPTVSPTPLPTTSCADTSSDCGLWYACFFFPGSCQETCGAC